MDEIIRLSVIFHGRVQGVGFRAYAIRCAQSCGITGWVQNKSDGTVAAEFQGTHESIDRVLAQIYTPPTYSRIEIQRIETKSIPMVESEIGISVKW